MNNSKLANISLILIGLMLICPFLYCHHAYPLTTFYQELMAGIFGVCAMSLLLAPCKSIEVPRIILLPIGLMSLAIVQYFIGRTDHLDQVLLFSLYMTFAALLMILGKRLRGELELKTIVTWLAVALLIGSELNTLAGILQHIQYDGFIGQFIAKKMTPGIYGNIAQSNQFADYVALGLISLWLLYKRFSIRLWQVSILASPMLFVMALSRSRTAIVYLMVILSVIFLRNPLVIKYRKLLYSLVALISISVIVFSIANYDQGIRLHLWRNAIYVFAQFPMIGAGLGQLAYQNMLLGSLHDKIIFDLYNNAHNLPLQIAAEFGLIGLTILLSTIILFICRAFKGQMTVYHLWGYACLSVIFVHSLVEYPLWYLYFIGIAALLLGLFDGGMFKIEFPKAGRVIIAVILIICVMSIVQIYRGYKHMELIDAYRKAASRDLRFIKPMQNELLAVYENTYLCSYAELFSAGMMRVNYDRAQEKLELNERAMRFIPIAPVVYHQAFFLEMMGRREEAKKQMERAIWNYPFVYQTAIVELSNLAFIDPLRFKFLLEFAQAEYAEYQMMIIN